MTGVAVDTNILVYAAGIARVPGDAFKTAASRSLLRNIHRSGTRLVVALQSLAELHYVLVRRGRRTPREAGEAVGRWRRTAQVAVADEKSLDDAIHLASTHKLQIYDAVIMASVIDHADVLLSEDMQDRFVWRGLTVVNPFLPTPDERIAKWLSA